MGLCGYLGGQNPNARDKKFKECGTTPYIWEEVMKVLTKIVTAAVLTTGIAAMSFSGADAADKVRWKMHAAFGQNVAVIGPPPIRVAKAIDRMSDGNFKIKVFEPGALVGGYAYYDPVSQGAIDAAFGTPGANSGAPCVQNSPIFFPMTCLSNHFFVALPTPKNSIGHPTKTKSYPSRVSISLNGLISFSVSISLNIASAIFFVFPVALL